MKRNDIVIGIVILAILAGVIYFVRRPKQKVEELPQIPTTQEKIEEAFHTQIPDDVDKAELTDVTGGSASGIATRKVENGQFIFSVLADLPDGTYTVLLGEDEMNLGTMRIAKGGYILEFSSSTDYSNQNSVVVRSGTTTILQGSF